MLINISKSSFSAYFPFTVDMQYMVIILVKIIMRVLGNIVVKKAINAIELKKRDNGKRFTSMRDFVTRDFGKRDIRKTGLENVILEHEILKNEILKHGILENGLKKT